MENSQETPQKLPRNSTETPTLVVKELSKREIYEKTKNEIVSEIGALKAAIKEKKPRKKRESKKKLPTFEIKQGPVVIKFD